MAQSLIRLDDNHISVNQLQMLQLRLPVDGSVVIGSVHAADWRDICEQLLGKILKTIYGAWIDMNWLRKKFGWLDEDSAEVQREQHTRAYTLMIIGGLLIPDKSRNHFHIRWLLKLIDFREASELN
ncbi:hypothetical protein J1N35_034497 [Gossypium stocksii]|uniref:Aminotransferase-like plant mobile domain-containing protein n=1 Tax=Gossypium stocksii TaxID=47602 RepID=A0A9D3US66_9ROSI|nr:hypothetical protein J1N35_034497 [Gossypium stocksii]